MLIKLFESSKNSRLVMDYAGIFSYSGLKKAKHSVRNNLHDGIRCFLPPNQLWDVSDVLNVPFGFNDPVHDL